MVYIYSPKRVNHLDGFYITPSLNDFENIKEDATTVYTYDDKLKEAYEQAGVIVNMIDPNISEV